MTDREKMIQEIVSLLYSMTYRQVKIALDMLRAMAGGTGR